LADIILTGIVFAADTCHSSSLRGAWYPVGLSVAAAFHNVLANSQNFIFQKNNGFYPSRDDALALVHHHKALRQASELMKSPRNHNSDEALSIVTSFMCHQVNINMYVTNDF
jgi:hypothetical protein